MSHLHQEDLSEDASDLIWSLMGTAMHTVLERAGIQSGKGNTEQRLYMDVDGVKLSGQFDYIDAEGVLWDWKFVSTYEFINGVKTSREQQLNVYAALAEGNAQHVSGLRVGFIFRDWSSRAAAADSSYPQQQAIGLELPLWDPQTTHEFIRTRLALHKQAQLDPQAAEVNCTPEERWAKPEAWAVRKNSNKRALRLWESEALANAFSIEQQRAHPKDKFSVEYRPGESTRCKYYCPVLKYCNQGQKYL